MKKHSIIPYFLLAFLTVVILLVGIGVGIALSFSFQTVEFLDLKRNIGIIDFISGADLLFSVFYFMFYFFLLGIAQTIKKFEIGTILVIQLLIFFILTITILIANPYLNYVNIKSSFMIYSIIVFAIALRINIDLFKQDIKFETSIDLIFYNFIQALLSTLVVLCTFFISSWTNPFNLEIVKLFIITYIYSFFCILAGTLPFYSLNKLYYNFEN